MDVVVVGNVHWRQVRVLVEDCGNSYYWNMNCCNELGQCQQTANLRPRMLGVSNPFYHNHIFHMVYQCLQIWRCLDT